MDAARSEHATSWEGGAEAAMNSLVIPAEAGVQCAEMWIPAFAGMTMESLVGTYRGMHFALIGASSD